MKRFVFTLGRILDYRQSLLEKEKNNLMGLFAERNALEDTIDSLNRQYAGASNELAATAERGTTVAEIQRLNIRITAFQRSIKHCQEQLAELEQRIDAQREVVKEASQEVTGLEKLRDKQREGYEYAQRKQEEERISELVSSKIARGEP